MSINHQYLEFSDKVAKRYVKVGINPLSGIRINPYNTAERIDFLLTTPITSLVQKQSPDGKITYERAGFSYEDEVLELYSDNEVKSFLRFNKKLIEEGKVKEYSEVAPEVNSANMLSDEEVYDIANVKTVKALRTKLTAITSPLTVQRIKSAAEDVGRSSVIVNAISSYLEELNEQSTEQNKE